MAGRVLVAMSGGVDSSMAAASVLEQGYIVSGVTLLLEPGNTASSEHAARVSAILGIPHTTLDMTQLFNERVVSPFRRSYLSGLTPNPCVVCNHFIKFGALMDYASAGGFDYLATGHYARILELRGIYKLIRGMDRSKDQSYFLYMLDQARLGKILFPLGGQNKKVVKAKAASLGIMRAVQANESQDVCFVPHGGIAAMLATEVGPVPGDIVDLSGRILGKHKGIAGYTIGQRRRLGVSSGEPLYVTGIDAKSDRLLVGPRSCLQRSSLTAADVSWVSGAAPNEDTDITAKIRHKSGEFAVKVIILHNKLRIAFDQPQFGVAPGQSVVLYHGDEVLGGAVIE